MEHEIVYFSNEIACETLGLSESLCWPRANTTHRMPHNDHMLVHHNGQDTFSLVKQRNTTTEDAKSLKKKFNC